MRYTVAFSKSIEGLIEDVNASILLGWRPLGGIAVVYMETFAAFYQAMVRETD